MREQRRIQRICIGRAVVLRRLAAGFIFLRACHAQQWQLQGGKKPNKVWSANMQSLFQLVYAMAENATGDTLIGSAVGMEHVVTSQAIPDGVAVMVLPKTAD